MCAERDSRLAPVPLYPLSRPPRTRSRPAAIIPRNMADRHPLRHRRHHTTLASRLRVGRLPITPPTVARTLPRLRLRPPRHTRPLSRVRTTPLTHATSPGGHSSRCQPRPRHPRHHPPRRRPPPPAPPASTAVPQHQHRHQESKYTAPSRPPASPQTALKLVAGSNPSFRNRNGSIAPTDLSRTPTTPIKPTAKPLVPSGTDVPRISAHPAKCHTTIRTNPIIPRNSAQRQPEENLFV